MDTPRKSREPPQTKVYSSNPYGVFPPHQMQYLKRYVDHVVETANFSENGPECQWGVVVCQLLHAFSWWPGEESIRPINMYANILLLDLWMGYTDVVAFTADKSYRSSLRHCALRRTSQAVRS